MTVDKQIELSRIKIKVAHQFDAENFQELFPEGMSQNVIDMAITEAHNKSINSVLKNVKLTPAQRVDVTQLIIK